MNLYSARPLAAESAGSDDVLARRLRALSHPARIAILKALGERAQCHCGEIVQALPLAQSTVSEHLRVLKEAGLIGGRISGPRTCYWIEREAITELSSNVSELLAGLVPQTATHEVPGKK